MVKSLSVFAILILSSSLFGCVGGGQPVAPPSQQEEQQSGIEDAESAVRELVAEFGGKLQRVSLLAPSDAVKESLQKEYGALVSPNLLARWQADPEHAPGRLTSSPWPDRIEVESVEAAPDGSYQVKGYVVEVTSVEKENGGAAARYPVTLTAGKVGDRWLITGFEQVIRYENQEYGFSFSLPAAWQGYRIVDDRWEGLAVGGAEPVASGPQLSIRHPEWTEEVPRQDIPIMIFTMDQWDALQDGEFHIGAAPIGPQELGRNSVYVFALPARYNYAFPLGYEEVEEILEGSPLQTFTPSSVEGGEVPKEGQ